MLRNVLSNGYNNMQIHVAAQTHAKRNFLDSSVSLSTAPRLEIKNILSLTMLPTQGMNFKYTLLFHLELLEDINSFMLFSKASM